MLRYQCLQDSLRLKIISILGMIWIPGGTFTMGGEFAEFMKEWPYIARSRNDERPIHQVQLSGFWISETPVTNQEFKEFVDITGYQTTAEKAPTLEEIMPFYLQARLRLRRSICCCILSLSSTHTFCSTE